MYTHKHTLGLVASNWGGTPIEAWSSLDALHKCSDEHQSNPPPHSSKFNQNPPPHSSKFNQNPPPHSSEFNQNSPTALWNAMIHPLINMTIKGVTWYQGESNAGMDTHTHTHTPHTHTHTHTHKMQILL